MRDEKSDDVETGVMTCQVDGISIITCDRYHMFDCKRFQLYKGEDYWLRTITGIVLEGCILSQYTRLLYWKDASHNTLDYCIRGMHLTIH